MPPAPSDIEAKALALGESKGWTLTLLAVFAGALLCMIVY